MHHAEKKGEKKKKEHSYCATLSLCPESLPAKSSHTVALDKGVPSPLSGHSHPLQHISYMHSFPLPLFFSSFQKNLIFRKAVSGDQNEMIQELISSPSITIQLPTCSTWLESKGLNWNECSTWMRSYENFWGQMGGVTLWPENGRQVVKGDLTLSGLTKPQRKEIHQKHFAHFTWLDVA